MFRRRKKKRKEQEIFEYTVEKDGFETYKYLMPKELESSLKAVSNKFRFALIMTLLNVESLSFSDLMRESGKEKGYLANHLRILESGGIIENYLQRKPGTKDFSFYKLSPFGKKIVLDLLSSYNEFYSSNNL